MRVVRNPDGESETIATDVEVTDSLLKQGLGLMFRRSIAEGYAMVFRFSGAKPRGLHMVGVPFDIDAVWVREDEVQQVKRLRAWRGHGKARCDTVVELPAGAAESVEPGDTLVVVE